MSNTEKSKRNRSSVSRDYLDALEDFWGGRSRTTLEHVSNFLADKPDHVDNLALYRLWIEVLADEGNFSGLRSLGQHLDSLVAGQTRQKSSFFALQGIVHFELDEIDFFSNINDIIILISFIILFGIFTSYISSYFMTQKYLKLKISR